MIRLLFGVLVMMTGCSIFLPNQLYAIGCDSENPCPSNATCVNSICIVGGCQNDNDCPSGQYCEDNGMCYIEPLQPVPGASTSNGGGNNSFPTVSSTSSTSSGNPIPPSDSENTTAGPKIRGRGLTNQKTDVLPNVPWTGKGLGTTGNIEVGERVLNTIKTTINRFLGFLAVIALALIIRSGFKILIGQDQDYSQAKTTLKNAFFGIIMIGISWLIVTFMFYITCVVTEGEYCTSADSENPTGPPSIPTDDGIVPDYVPDVG